MIHMTVLLKRKEGMSIEDFNDYWANTHADIFMGDPVARSNLVKYSQQHIDHESNAKLAAAGAKTPEADGVVHIYAESLDKLMAVFESDYHKNIVVPDAEKFLAVGQEQVTIGVDDDKWADGKPGAGVNTKNW